MTTLCRSLLAPLRLFLRQSLAVQVLGGLLAGLVVGLWLLALLAVLLLPLGFPAWQDASLFRPSLLEAPKQLNLLELFIPVNPFEAFATTQIPAVVLFSLCLGIALIGVPARQNLISILDRLSDGLLAISAFVARFTPIGVFAILAGTTAQVSAAEIPRLGIYLFLQGGIVLLFTLVVLPQLIAACTPIGAGRLLRCFRTPLTIAFATANLFVVLPLLVEQGKRLIVEARIERRGSQRGSQTEAMPQSNRRAMEAELEAEVELPVEVLTPLALVFPDMGRLLSLAFVPFAGWLNGNPMPLAGVPEFLMTGLASSFLEGVMAMTFLLNRLGLPTDLVQLYIAIDQLAIARMGTLLACMSVISLVILATWLSLPLFIGAARLAFNRLPPPGQPLRRELETRPFLRARGPAVLVDAKAPALEQPGRWEAIQRRGAIRFCTQTNDVPMAFRNASGALVGADVELALLFAEQMNLKARFLPLGSGSGGSGSGGGSGEQALRNGRCDMTIALKAPAPDQASALRFSTVQEVYGVSLLLHGERLRNARTWAELRQLRDLRVGLPSASPFLLQWTQHLLPNASIHPQQPLRALVRSLQSGRVDAVLIAAQKGAAWTVLEPEPPGQRAPRGVGSLDPLRQCRPVA